MNDTPYDPDKIITLSPNQIIIEGKEVSEFKLRKKRVLRFQGKCDKCQAHNAARVELELPMIFSAPSLEASATCGGCGHEITMVWRKGDPKK